MEKDYLDIRALFERQRQLFDSALNSLKSIEVRANRWQ
jgi:hypothetical protein